MFFHIAEENPALADSRTHLHRMLCCLPADIRHRRTNVSRQAVLRSCAAGFS